MFRTTLRFLDMILSARTIAVMIVVTISATILSFFSSGFEPPTSEFVCQWRTTRPASARCPVVKPLDLTVFSVPADTFQRSWWFPLERVRWDREDRHESGLSGCSDSLRTEPLIPTGTTATDSLRTSDL